MNIEHSQSSHRLSNIRVDNFAEFCKQAACNIIIISIKAIRLGFFHILRKFRKNAFCRHKVGKNAKGLEIGGS